MFFAKTNALLNLLSSTAILVSDLVVHLFSMVLVKWWELCISRIMVLIIDGYLEDGAQGRQIFKKISDM